MPRSNALVDEIRDIGRPTASTLAPAPEPDDDGR